MHTSTNTHSRSSNTVTPSNAGTTITTPPTPSVSKYYFANTIQAIFAQSEKIFEKQHEEMKQLIEKHEESSKIENEQVNIKSETLHLL